MGNQLVTSGIRKLFHTGLVNVIGNLFEFLQNLNEIISYFHENTICLSFKLSVTNHA